MALDLTHTCKRSFSLSPPRSIVKRRRRSSSQYVQAFVCPTSDRGMELAYLTLSSSSVLGGSIRADTAVPPTSAVVTPLSSHRYGSGHLSPQIQKGKVSRVIGAHIPTLSHTLQCCPIRLPIACVPSREKISPFEVEATISDSIHRTGTTAW